MSMYRVGDFVTIRDDLSADFIYPCATGADVGICGPMIDLGGSTAKITAYVGNGIYKIDLDRGRWSWVDAMFAGYSQTPDFPQSDMTIESLLGIEST